MEIFSLLIKPALAALTDPLGGKSMQQVLEGIGDFIFQIGLALCVIATLWAAILFLTAGGNPQRVSSARTAIFWALVGVVVVLIGKGISTTVKSVLGGGGLGF